MFILHGVGLKNCIWKNTYMQTWQVQLVVNVHKVRDGIKLLFKKHRADIDTAYGIYHC